MIRLSLDRAAFWILFIALWLPLRAFSADGKPNISRVKEIIRMKLPQRDARTAHKISRAVIREGRRHDVDPLLVLAVIEQESGFKLKSRGRHGEIGLMQVKPQTARWLERKRYFSWPDTMSLEDPENNIAAGTAYLAFLKKRFRGHRLTLAAYNSGPYNVRKQIQHRSVPRKYASKVLKRYQKLQVAISRRPLRV